MVARQAHNLKVGVFKSILRNQANNRPSGVVFLFIYVIMVNGNDVSHLEIENREDMLMTSITFLL